MSDMRAANGHVRFAPNRDRESGFLQQPLSALPQKADICSAPSLEFPFARAPARKQLDGMEAVGYDRALGQTG